MRSSRVTHKRTLPRQRAKCREQWLQVFVALDKSKSRFRDDCVPYLLSVPLEQRSEFEAQPWTIVRRFLARILDAQTSDRQIGAATRRQRAAQSKRIGKSAVERICARTPRSVAAMRAAAHNAIQPAAAAAAAQSQRLCRLEWADDCPRAFNASGVSAAQGRLQTRARIARQERSCVPRRTSNCPYRGNPGC